MADKQKSMSDAIRRIGKDTSLTGRQKFERAKRLSGTVRERGEKRDKRGEAFRKAKGKRTIADRLREASEPTKTGGG